MTQTKEYDNSKKKRTLKKYLFVLAMICVPMLNFAIFYVYVNFQSVFMGFQNIDGSITLKWFKVIIESIFVDKTMVTDLKNTMIYFASSLIITMPLTAIISYFIYKKIFLYKFFRVMFFMPSILSAVVLTILYQRIMSTEGPIAIFFQKIYHLEDAPALLGDKRFATWTILVFTIWTGFSTNLLLLTGAMARIPADVLEAAQIDGITWGRELVSIIIPLVWPTVTTLIVLTFVNMFTASGPIFLFTEGKYETSTISFFIFEQVYAGGNVNYASAVGIFFTIISVPIVLLVKKLMERWQDAIEY